MFGKEEIKELAMKFENSQPQEIIQWAVGSCGKDMAFACSFGMEDVCIVDMLAKCSKEPRIFYLDTSLFFKETYDLIKRLGDRYEIKFECSKPKLSLEQQAHEHGEELWKTNPDLCCALRKVEPLQQKLSTLKAWMTGIRREQAPTRANAQVVEWDDKFKLIKINPIVRWKSQDVLEYISKHSIPYNPLHDKGYPSIGCEPCTYPVKPGEDPRSGRWKGLDKTECGLHK